MFLRSAITSQKGSVFAGVLKRSHVGIPDEKKERQSLALWEEWVHIHWEANILMYIDLHIIAKFVELHIDRPKFLTYEFDNEHHGWAIRIVKL